MSTTPKINRTTHDLSKVVTSRPVDGTAARVTSQGPKGYESSKKITQTLSATPIATRPIPRTHTFVDLRGVRRGKLTVIGLADEPQHKVRWVCKCVCGYYLTRTTDAIRNDKNIQDACDRCRQVAYLRRKSHFIQTGQDKDITEFL